MESPQGVNRLQLVRWEFGVAWASLDMHLDQLTDDECLWEPATPCWTVRRGAKGRWIADWQVPMPEPLPVTTIGWRTWRIGSWWSRALDSTFTGGDAGNPASDTSGDNGNEDILDWIGHAARDHPVPESRTRVAVDWPGDAELTAQWLRRLHARWLAALGGLAENDLDAFDRSVWLQRGTRPLAHLLIWVNSELTRSAAEIGLLRSLYASAG